MRKLIITICLTILLAGCVDNQAYYYQQEMRRLKEENANLRLAMMAGRDVLVRIANDTDFRAGHWGIWHGQGQTKQNLAVKNALAEMDKTLKEADDGEQK